MSEPLDNEVVKRVELTIGMSTDFLLGKGPENIETYISNLRLIADDLERVTNGTTKLQETVSRLADEAAGS